MINDILTYLDALQIAAFVGLGWPGWLQGLAFVGLVAVIAYGLTNVLKHGAILLKPDLKARSAADPESWQWTWRGVAVLWGLAFGGVLGAASPLLIVVGAVAGLCSSAIVAFGRAQIRSRFGAELG